MGRFILAFLVFICFDWPLTLQIYYNLYSHYNSIKYAGKGFHVA
jgi:hypothetical protein